MSMHGCEDGSLIGCDVVVVVMAVGGCGGCGGYGGCERGGCGCNVCMSARVLDGHVCTRLCNGPAGKAALNGSSEPFSKRNGVACAIMICARAERCNIVVVRKRVSERGVCMCIGTEDVTFPSVLAVAFALLALLALLVLCALCAFCMGEGGRERNSRGVEIAK